MVSPKKKKEGGGEGGEEKWRHREVSVTMSITEQMSAKVPLYQSSLGPESLVVT